jgi:hypothetical protein
MMMGRIPFLILSSAGVRRVLKVEEMTVTVTVLRKRKRKKNGGVVISSLVSPISESLTTLPTEGLLIIIRQGWQTLWLT